MNAQKHYIGEGVEILRRVHLRGHEDSMKYIAWSNDGRYLTTVSDVVVIWNLEKDSTRGLHGGNYSPVLAITSNNQYMAIASDISGVDIWNIASADPFLVDSIKCDDIVRLNWSPDNKLLAMCREGGYVQFWSPIRKEFVRELGNGETSNFTDLTWHPKTNIIAASSKNGYIYMWSFESGKLIQAINAHTDYISEIAWSPDGKVLASCSFDQTIRIIDIYNDNKGVILEGHTNSVQSVSFSYDNKFLASKSSDGTIRIWDREVWQNASKIDIPSKRVVSNLAFHPKYPVLATTDETNRGVVLLKYDTQKLVQRAERSSMARYTNAKVVLVGDSGVGKSGLALVLSGQPFRPTISTHGRHVWLFDSHKVRLENGVEENREIMLWDLAGQPGYRLIHQLHLHEVNLALLVFDAAGEVDPFSGVRHWDKALRQAQRFSLENLPAMKKILVSSRVDRGGSSVSDQRISSILTTLSFDDYARTSAKEGWGINDLMDKIKGMVNWQLLPKVVSTKLFQQIKEFIINQKISGAMLISFDQLLQDFATLYPNLTDENLKEQFSTCIGRLESRGLVRRLSFGGLVLLQPELIDSYAGAIVNAARDEPDGLGCIKEHDVLEMRFRMSNDERIYDVNRERLLLVSTIEDLVRHEIALREKVENDHYLIFPSHLTRERIINSKPSGISVVFDFEGPIQNIYAILVVRLSRSAVFEKKELWKYIATFYTPEPGHCGIYLRELEDGIGEVSIFFENLEDESIKLSFEAFVESHLLTYSVPNSVKKKQVVVCDHCGWVASDEVINLRISKGHDWCPCPICEKRVPLVIDRNFMVPSQRSVVIQQMSRVAELSKNISTSSIVSQGKMITKDNDVYVVQRLNAMRTRLQLLLIKKARYGFETPTHDLMEIDELQKQIEEIEKSMNEDIN